METTARGRHLDRVVKVVIMVRRLEEGSVPDHRLFMVDEIVTCLDLTWKRGNVKLNHVQVMLRC
jgi:hypothetical protein